MSTQRSRMSYEAVVFILIILIWCWSTGLTTNWCEKTRRTYCDLYPYVGHASQTHYEESGGAIWWSPASFEVMKSISLIDAMEPCIQADVCMKLFAGFDCVPGNEAIATQIKRIAAIPGVTYCSRQNKFQIDADSADELMSITHKMIRITKGVEIREDMPKETVRDKLRTKLQKYSAKHIVQKS